MASRDRKIMLGSSALTVLGTAVTAAVSSQGKLEWAAASGAALLATGAQLAWLRDSGEKSGPASADRGVRRVVNMPAPSAAFVDRKELLAEFSAMAKRPSSPVRARVFVIHGPSGYGKSRAAYACAERFFERYDFIWLLNAESEETLNLAFSRLARHLGLDRAASWDDLRDALWPALAASGRWLLVYDNVPRRGGVLAHLPQCGGGDVIVTTQATDWAGHADTVTAVGPLPLKESARLFQEFGIDSTAFAKETETIAEAFGGRPLDLLLAASTMRAEQYSPRAYIGMLAREADAAKAPGASSDPAASAIDYARFREANPAAFELLSVLAWFSGTDIPGGLVRRHAGRGPGGPVWDDAAFRTLTQYGLVGGDRDQITVHDGIRDDVRALSDPAACASVVRMLAAEFPADPSDPAVWPLCDALAQHVTQAAQAAARLGVKPRTRAGLLVAVARYFHVRDYLDRAATLFREAMTTYQDAGDAEGEGRARAGLSRVVFNIGRDMPAAETEARTAVGLVTAHDDRCVAALALAQILRETGRYDEGREVLTGVLASAGLVGRASDVCLELANLARRAGRVGTALRDTTAVVEAMEREHGDAHPATGSALRQLGQALADVQRYPEAYDALQRSLTIFRAATGPDSQELSLKAEETLGSVAVRLGRPAEALELLDHVVQAREAAQDRNPSNIAGAKARRSDARRASGDPQGALTDVEDSYRLFSDLGSDGRSYLTMPLVRKGPLLAELGRGQDGEDTAREALRLSQESYGEDHLLVAEAYSGLADVLSIRGEADAAQAARDQAAAIVAAALKR